MDAYVAATLAHGLVLEAGGSWLQTSVEASPEFAFALLPQRPVHELFTALDWQSAAGVDLRGELRRAGYAFDIADDGTAVPLRAGTQLNLQASLRLVRLGVRESVHLVIAVENAMKQVIEPQLGLPLPGRTVRVGLRL